MLFNKYDKMPFNKYDKMSFNKYDTKKPTLEKKIEMHSFTWISTEKKQKQHLHLSKKFSDLFFIHMYIGR